jgi:hypothetical protein
MSDYADEQLYRIALAVEKLAEQKKSSSEDMVVGIHTFYAVEIARILDALMDDFSTRRALRKLADSAKRAAEQ